MGKAIGSTWAQLSLRVIPALSPRRRVRAKLPGCRASTYQSYRRRTTFWALQKEAKTAGRTTAEYLRLHALEGFLLRLAHSPYRNRFV
jgi:hypothetical protein